MLALHPAGADTQSETTTGHLVERCRGFRDHRRVTERDRCHENNELDRFRDLGEAAERRESVRGWSRTFLVQEVMERAKASSPSVSAQRTSSRNRA